MFDAVIAWLQQIANSIPLPFFVMVGGIVEEIIAPIPSPLVASLAGSITEAQHLGIPYLMWICLLATIAKTLGAWIFYFLGDKFEDVAVPRFGKYIGVTHQHLERFGKHFSGSNKDVWILLGLRAIPVMPSTPLSLVVGVLKIRARTFFISTFVGFYIRNFFFMLLGYTGLSAADSLMSGLDTAETVLKIGMVLIVGVVLAWLYWRRHKGKSVDFLKD